MFAPQEQSFEAWMKPSQDMFNYWVSFFPTAPLFGVEWRFGQVTDFGFPSPAPQSEPAETKSTEVTPVAYNRVEPQLVKTEPKSVPEAEVLAESKPAAKKPALTVVETPVEEEATAKPKGLLAKAPADADDLKLIKGVGPGLEKQLNELGVYRFKQLAKFKEADLAWIDDNLSAFKGRCFRDDWVGQAKTLIK